MTALPAWMYDDPAEVVERVENAELRAASRARIRELEEERRAGRIAQLTFESTVAIVRRVIFAPPDIRMKRARIQALTRAAMKGLK
jgi:hypothetical protein